MASKAGASAAAGDNNDGIIIISPDEFRRRLDDLGNAYSATSSRLDAERSRRTDDSGKLARELAETRAELEKLKLRLQDSEARGSNLAEKLASGESLVGKDAGTNGVAATISGSSLSVASSPPPSDVAGLQEENAVLRARLSALESDLNHIVAKEKQELVLGILESLGGGDEEEAEGGGGTEEEEDSVAMVLRRHVSPEDVLALTRSQNQQPSAASASSTSSTLVGGDAAIQILTDRWVPAIPFAMGRYEKSRLAKSEGCSGRS